MNLGIGNCPICGLPRGGNAKSGRDHTACAQKLQAQNGKKHERPSEKKLPKYSKSTIDYLCKRYDK